MAYGLKGSDYKNGITEFQIKHQKDFICVNLRLKICVICVPSYPTKSHPKTRIYQVFSLILLCDLGVNYLLNVCN